MCSLTTLLLSLLAATASANPLRPPLLAPCQSSSGGGSISITPHDRYSSSVGVLGCKIDVNRVAYWPSTPSCDSPCVKVSSGGRSLHLLHVDQSGGAYDVSYDAWNVLTTGQSALAAPSAGGGVDATWEPADAAACADIFNGTAGARVPLAAASPNWVVGCPEGSWVRENYALYNVYDPVCKYGYDEECTWTAGGGNPTCPHMLGSMPVLSTTVVWNIDYPTGQLSEAL